MPNLLDVIERVNPGPSIPESAPRYQNSYRLDPSNPLKIGPIERLVEEIMNDNFEGVVYDTTAMPKLCRETAAEIRGRIRELRFDRYKYVVTVTVAEKLSQGVECGLGYLWDHKRDDYTYYSLEAPTFVALCCVLAIYYE